MTEQPGAHRTDPSLRQTLDDLCAEIGRGVLSAPVGLMRLLIAAEDVDVVAAAVAPHAALRALLAAHRYGCARMRLFDWSVEASEEASVEAELGWPRDGGVILFEGIGKGAQQDQLRRDGFHVIGGGALGDRRRRLSRRHGRAPQLISVGFRVMRRSGPSGLAARRQ
jgi:hypothetical protein